MSHATQLSDSGSQSGQSDAAVLDAQALVALARDAGMLVILDGQIGRERYESVTGSVATLVRFAQALQLSALKAA
ncbi:hypothetical protein [Burkholderia arboris]|uniref:hypothetical protein n=1 Tax=Burkholderia arboris TaxID=488730 RepID=UPI001CA43AD8|nr:hypothetical protein [Burkholderia arboris]MBY8604734.1 hypothetical protein [Burkholderia arboris]MCA8049789.1 hypothetical protein [Burkholderia arboris]